MADDEKYMQMALKEAKKAMSEGEVPIGAVVVCAGRVIASAHNLTETLHDVTAHAEMQAITMAADYLGGKYLADCTLYVTYTLDKDGIPQLTLDTAKANDIVDEQGGSLDEFLENFKLHNTT